MGVLEQLGLAGPVALRGKVTAEGGSDRRVIARVTRDGDTHPLARSKSALRVEPGAHPSDNAGFAAILLGGDAVTPNAQGLRVSLPETLRYLDEGDVVCIDPTSQRLDVMYRRHSEHNSLLVTERCNSRCVMCSQPPILHDDGYLVDELLQALPLMNRETGELGLTGGEPTLLHDGLLRIIQTARDVLPSTQLHVLSNGRLFAYTAYATRVAAARHPGLIFGVPVFSDVPAYHDLVVQAAGAFDQTIRGLLNLARNGICVEIRVVVHRLTYRRLHELAQFIVRNLSFAEHVAVMGLETVGYTRANMDAVWIDPAEYRQELSDAVVHLDRAGMDVSIYNHQLCVLPRELWRFSRRSISDWKNIYMPECGPCQARAACGGFFAASTRRYSRHIAPISRDSANGTPNATSVPLPEP
jgi:His-Xaa-Ser system radical SAM maturase HxsC